MNPADKNNWAISQGYTGWNDYQDQVNRGGATSIVGGTANDILSTAIQSITQYIKKVTPYDQVNPFSFDESLAKEASTAEYTPYYQELLTDYTSNVERTKSRSQEDLSTTLKQLEAGKEYYTGTQRLLLDKALKSTNEGYAGRGLYVSGARQKDLADIQQQNTLNVGNYTTNYDYNKAKAQTLAQRTGENVDTAASQYSRDTEREKQAAIEAGVLQRKSEYQTQYEAARSKYYQNSYGGLA